MSQPFHVRLTPAARADFTPEWLRLRREIVLRDGHALRLAAAPALRIEVQDINRGTWHPLTLPGDVLDFDAEATRDEIYNTLVGMTPIRPA